MAQTDLLSLPPEILELVFDQVQASSGALNPDTGDDFKSSRQWVGLFDLSCTCSFLRAQLAPRLFAHLCFTSRDGSAKSAMLAAKKYGTYVKHLAFLGVSKHFCDVPFEVRGRNRRRIAMTGEEEAILCNEGRELLRGSHTPNARMLDVKFEFDFGDPDSEFNENVEDHTPDFDEIETPKMIRVQEAERPWRALMKVVWQNVARNDVVRKLNFLWMPPKLCSAFYEPAFKRFLGRLHSLNLLFKPTFDEWATHCDLNSFIAAVADLDALLFYPATQLSAISCFAPMDGLFGNVTPLPFALSRFPNLVRLSLIHVGLCHDLVVFLERHLCTLKHVAFLDCWSGRSTEVGEWPVKWAEVFSTLQQPASKINRFTCMPTDWKIIQGPEESDRRRWLSEDPLWADVENLCEADKSRKVFAYVDALDLWGLPTPSPQGMLSSLRMGEDQEAFEGLLALTDQNAKRTMGDAKPHHHADI